ncbi:MAG: aminopeptidase P family protein [Limnochordales bacterium]|nr:aminopeptidase P family protein [Limnochordales bacterium]
MAYCRGEAQVSGRLARLRAGLRERGADAILVFGLENMRYLSGFTGDSGAVLISETAAVLITDFRYVEQAREEAPGFRIVKHDDFFETLAGEVRGLGLRSLAYEGDKVSVRRFARLQEVLPEVSWVDQNGLVEGLRAVKDEEELKFIAEAAAIADQAFTHILQYVREGVTEREIALELEWYLKRHSEGPAFTTIVASGPRGALPHAQPTDKELRRGELVVLDWGAVVNGYHSDMTRTVAVGAADARSREIYEIVLRAQLAGLEAVRPGRCGREVDAVAREVIAAAGYGEYFGHGLGHGVGLAIHEDPPRLSPRGESLLAANMVVTVEPGIYLPGFGGVRIEDLVVVTDEGARRLSQSPKDLMIVG